MAWPRPCRPNENRVSTLVPFPVARSARVYPCRRCVQRMSPVRASAATKILVGAIEVDFPVTHRHRAAVDRLIILGVRPQHLLLVQVIGGQDRSETPGHTRFRIVTCTQISPTPTAELAISLRGLDARVSLAGQACRGRRRRSPSISNHRRRLES